MTGGAKMARELPDRTIALIALALAVFSLVFCWAWTLRCSSTIERHECEILSTKWTQDELAHQMLNLGALLMRSDEDLLDSPWILSTYRATARACETESSGTFKTIEAARANGFLRWYYASVEKRPGSQ